MARSPTAACGGRSQRSAPIAAAACARRAPCEPFEAAPSFLCHGVDAARQLARCPAIANFTLLATQGVASYCVLLRAVANWSIWPARTADQESGRADAKLRRRKRAVEDYIARPMAAVWPKNAKRGETRAGSTIIEARTSRTTDPSRPVRHSSTIKGRPARRFGAAPRSVLCASFYTGGSGRNAAATPPANDAFITAAWAAPPRNRSRSRRRRRSEIFESSSSGNAAAASSARSMSC